MDITGNLISASDALCDSTAFEWITFDFNRTTLELHISDLDRPASEWNIPSCTAFEHVLFDSTAFEGNYVARSSRTSLR